MERTARERASCLTTWAPLVIRLALAAIFIAHGAQKVFGAFDGHGIRGLAGFVGELGFRPPIVWAWLAALAEFLGGIGVLLGLLTRIAAAGILANMLVAILKVHAPNGFFLPDGIEFALANAAMALSLILSGAGKVSLDWVLREWWLGRRRR